MNRTRSPAETAARKERQEKEGKVNMARYLQQQQATLDKTARLRAVRLARSQPTPPNKRAARPKGDASRRLLPGLHQGIRG